MRERINRQTDENLYQPKIHSARIRQLYILKTITGLPMTVLADLAIRELVASYRVNNLGNENRGRTYYAE
jgi:hypothetical protein